MKEQTKFSAVIMRGGTSKGVFLKAEEMPSSEEQREKLILSVFGSPDKRQIDGLGGADYLTSKCAIMGLPTRPDADIDYTFAQVMIPKATVAFDLNCGNISAAAALYAVEEGFVQLTEPKTTVRVHNTNTGRILSIAVPIKEGEPAVEGDFSIDGVPGSGAEVELDFSDTAGACSGALLPTGAATNTIRLQGMDHDVQVSVVDVGNACVFVRARDIGLTGTELPGDFPDSLYDLMEDLRMQSAKLSGLSSDSLPLQVIVSEPRSYTSFVPGRSVDESEIDVVARLFLERMAHKAYAGTGGCCIAVAAKITGTVVNDVARKRNSKTVNIGHPSGVLPIGTDVHQDGSNWTVRQATFSRTARRLMEGSAYVKSSLLA